MHRRRLLDVAASALAIGSIAALLSACGTSAPARTTAQTQPEPLPAATVDATGAGETGAEQPPDIEAILAANAEALRDLDSMPIDRRTPTKQPESAQTSDPAPRDTVVPAITKAPAEVKPPVVEPEPEPQLTRKQRISMAAEELAMLLRAEADQSDAPISSMAALSALELIERGVAPDPESMPWLTDRERELLTVFRDLFIEAGGRLQSDPNDLLSLHDIIEQLPGKLSSWKQLSIPVAALCVRVDGFGQYEEFASNTLLAGQPHRMIVYTELADFRSEAAIGPHGHAGRRVRLTQDLSLYHDADGLLAWREANQTINEFSRNERSDFFLVQLIELPRTLTVGAYRLKVTLVDEVAGATAESIIPINVVADVGLAGR